jgi:hypothetical protein
MATAWVSLGDAYAILAPSGPNPAADWREARDAFRRGLEEWKKLPPFAGRYDVAHEVAQAEARLGDAERRLAPAP